MLCPPSEEESINNTKKVQPTPQQRRKNKKSKRKNKQNKFINSLVKKKNSKFEHTMSSWAESFTVAATWQLKHELAYWKAKAKSLEYENGVLHDIIRKKNGIPGKSGINVKSESEFEDEDNHNEEVEDNHNEGDNFEVSEEFIEFLKTNAKYKEDARLERELLQAKENPINEEQSEIKHMDVEPSESLEGRQRRLKNLYGKNWQKILSLELSLQSEFMNQYDKDKPMFWPNIPFNFS